MSVFEELFGTHVVDVKGNKVSVKEISENNDVIGIYFSAHWCPPCQSFTPKLSAFYEEHRAAGRKFEVVFVSSDKDASSWEEYFHQMPWLAVPFGDPIKDELATKYSLKGIPTLIILDAKTAEVMTRDGRSPVTNEPNNFPWNQSS